jgi:hypothetical protein
VKKSFTVQTEKCPIHPSYLVTWSLEATETECEVVEGAFEGYLNFADCTVCAAEAVGLNVDTYLDIFIHRFLPLLHIQLPDLKKIPTFHVNLPKPLSYG